LKATEKLIEALEFVQDEIQRIKDAKENEIPDEKFEKNPILLGLTPSKYMLKQLRDIASSELEQTLLLLPFHYISTLFDFFQEWMVQKIQVEFVSRCFFVFVENTSSSNSCQQIVFGSIASSSIAHKIKFAINQRCLWIQ